MARSFLRLDEQFSRDVDYASLLIKDGRRAIGLGAVV